MGYSDPNPECGIYVITCGPTGRVYVGSTASMKDRWRDHRYELNTGRHKNPVLLKAWRKHGAAAFTFSVAGLCTEVERLVQERAWIDKLGAWAPAGFNVADPQDPSRQAARDYVLTDPEGREQTVHNLHRWCRENGTPTWSANLVLVAQAKKPSHCGWLCRYAYESASAWSTRVDVMMAARTTKSRIYKGGYVVTAPDGTEHDVMKPSVWCAERGLDQGCLIRVADGRAAHHFGYRARRKVGAA